MYADVDSGRPVQLKVLLFEHASLAAIAALEANPASLADYQAEAREWAELDSQVIE